MSVMPPFAARGLISSDERWPGEILPGARKRARGEQRLKLGTALGCSHHRGVPHTGAVTSNTEPTLRPPAGDRKSTRLNSSHTVISYAVFCLKKKIKIKARRLL